MLNIAYILALKSILLSGVARGGQGPPKLLLNVFFLQ